jgi:membrane protein
MPWCARKGLDTADIVKRGDVASNGQRIVSDKALR